MALEQSEERTIRPEVTDESVSIVIVCIGLDKQNFERKIVNIFLPISFNLGFGSSKEPSQ